MFESDADRLALIKSLGGQLVRHQGGEFWAIFDNSFFDANVGDIDVEGTQPSLTARTSDIEQIGKGTSLALKDFAGRDATYHFDKHEPDGTGMSRILLSL